MKYGAPLWFPALGILAGFLLMAAMPLFYIGHHALGAGIGIPAFVIFGWVSGVIRAAKRGHIMWPLTKKEIDE